VVTIVHADDDCSPLKFSSTNAPLQLASKRLSCLAASAGAFCSLLSLAWVHVRSICVVVSGAVS
jgi:hypothetical protein